MNNAFYENRLLSIYTFCHFCVDGMCAFILLSCAVGRPYEAYIFLLCYHGMAFLIQPICGLLTDKYNRINWGQIGTALCLAGGLFSCFSSGILFALSIMILGLGNAFFHIEGGYVSLHRKDEKVWPGGFFVGGGAIGIGLGTITGMSCLNSSFIQKIPYLCLFGVLPLVLTLIFKVTREKRESWQEIGIINKDLSIGLLSLFIIISIIARGITGALIPKPVFHGTIGLLLNTIPICAGKMSGGFLADHFGARRIVIFGHLASAVLSFFTLINIYFSLPAIFCINLSMGVTLASLNDAFPNRTGFAFGLSPLALYIAYVISQYISFGNVGNIALSIVLELLSVIFCAKCVINHKIKK